MNKLPAYLTEIEAFAKGLSRESEFLAKLKLDEMINAKNIQKGMQSIFMQDLCRI